MLLFKLLPAGLALGILQVFLRMAEDPALVRRLKADLAKEKGFKQREFKSLTFTPSDDEVREFALLDQIIAASARSGGGKGGSAGLVAMLLKKRFLSSPWSFALTLRGYTEADSDGHRKGWNSALNKLAAYLVTRGKA